MSEMNMVQAVNSALDVMLERDENVLVFGEDVGYFGGVSAHRMAFKRSMARREYLTPHFQKEELRR